MPHIFKNQEGFNLRAGYRLSESAAMQPRLCAARLNVKRLNLPARMVFFWTKKSQSAFWRGAIGFTYEASDLGIIVRLKKNKNKILYQRPLNLLCANNTTNMSLVCSSLCSLCTHFAQRWKNVWACKQYLCKFLFLALVKLLPNFTLFCRKNEVCRNFAPNRVILMAFRLVNCSLLI